MKPVASLIVFLCLSVGKLSAQKVSLDLYGDPLPKHAVGQLGTSRFRPQSDTIERISWSPDGRFLATLASLAIGANDPGIEIWDAETQLAAGPRKLVHRVIHAMAWSPDGRQLAVCPDSGSVEVWDVLKNTLIKEFSSVNAHFYCADWSPDGKRIAVGRRESGRVILDAASLKIEIELDRPARSLDFSDNSKWLATGNDDLVQVWEISNRKLRYEIDLKPATPETRTPSIYSIKFSPDGRSLVVTGDHTSVIDLSGDHSRAHLLKTADGEPLDSYGISFNLDGSQFVTAGFSRARLWDAGTRKLLRDYPDESGFAVDFSPDGESLAFALRRLGIFDVTTGLDRNPRAAHRRVVLDSAMSPDGQSAYTIATGPTIRKWDTQSTRQISKLRLPHKNA